MLGIVVCSTAIMSVYNYAMRMLAYLGRRATILTFSGPLKTPTPTILSFHSSSNGVNEPFV